MTSALQSTSSLGTTTDATLLRRIGEQDPEALSQLLSRHGPILLGLGKRILGSLADAEEILQEVFLYVWNQAERYDAKRSSVGTWLVLLMRSRAIDRWRKRAVIERTHEAAQAPDPPVVDASTGGPESVIHRERRERIRDELAKLPAEQREVLSMAFYQGLTQTEIAARTGLPLGTVKTRTLLAMKKLRGALRDEIRQLL
jgi:RNA polymerase sigma-70 factor (ECF subfamily)